MEDKAPVPQEFSKSAKWLFHCHCEAFPQRLHINEPSASRFCTYSICEPVMVVFK